MTLDTAPDRPALSSGLVAFNLDRIDDLADSPAVFRLRASSQSVMYIGHSGDSGLRDELGRLFRSGVFYAAERFEFELMDSAEAAGDEARQQIAALRPLYNLGYARYRNPDVETPRRGPRVRPASPNP